MIFINISQISSGKEANEKKQKQLRTLLRKERKLSVCCLLELLPMVPINSCRDNKGECFLTIRQTLELRTQAAIKNLS